MEEKIIKVFDITKNYAVDASIGSVVYNQINDVIESYDSIVIDFSGVDIILSVFINAVISNFCQKDKTSQFEKISVINLSDSAKILWDRVVQSAKRKCQEN